MGLPIGKIVSSSSHLLYEARIYDESECAEPPGYDDFHFGSLLAIAPGDEATVAVGALVNSQLINPDAGHYGPRLTVPHRDNAVFAPDYLHELGILISVLLLGTLSDAGARQGMVGRVLPVGSEVSTLSAEDCLRFHRDPQGQLQLKYFGLLLESGLPFSASLCQALFAQLMPACTPHEQKMLQALHTQVQWQSTLGALRS